MARFFFAILTIISLVACRQRSASQPSAKEAKVIYLLPYSMENRQWLGDYILPAHYNIELIEEDTLSPVMQITYSVRRHIGDSYDWVDTVLRMPMSVQQCQMFKDMLKAGSSSSMSH